MVNNSKDREIKETNDKSKNAVKKLAQIKDVYRIAKLIEIIIVSLIIFHFKHYMDLTNYIRT